MTLIDFDSLDRARAAGGFTVHDLCRAAKISDSTWRRMRSRVGNSGNITTYRRLWGALDQLKKEGPKVQRDQSFLRQCFRGYVVAVASAMGLDYQEALNFSHHDNKPKDPHWLALSRARQLAVYLVCIEHDVGASELAPAIGITKQAISKARQTVEDRRDDPDFELLVEQIGQAMSGRAA